MNVKTLLPATLILLFSLMGCSSSNKEFDDVLSKFDEMVGVYENYVKKDPFCAEYIVQINGEVMTKLNDIGAKAKAVRENGPPPSKEQIDRYTKITTRMSSAMMALSGRMKDVKMCGNAMAQATQSVAPDMAPAPAPVAVPAPEPTPVVAPAPVAPAVVVPAQSPAPQPASSPVNHTEIKASFDCAAASTAVERMICSSQELAALDVQLSAAYKKARSAATEPEKLKSEQVSWVKQSRKCADESCLLQSYKSRIAELSK